MLLFKVPGAWNYIFKMWCDILKSVKNYIFVCWFYQIVALNKTKERMRPYQGNQEEEDPDIKKIKKVLFHFSTPFRLWSDNISYFFLSIKENIYSFELSSITFSKCSRTANYLAELFGDRDSDVNKVHMTKSHVSKYSVKTIIKKKILTIAFLSFWT